MKRFAAIILLLGSISVYGQAPVGQISDFSAEDVNTGKPVALSQYKEEKGLVVIFRGNECPFDEYYNQRLAELIKAYQDKIPFVLVNPYLEAPESADKMKMYSTVWGLNVPYLADKDQAVMTVLGARKTPEAFVLKSNNGAFSVVYSGAIDDNPQLPAGVKQKHLQAAIDALLAGQKNAATSVRSTGCTIRKR